MNYRLQVAGVVNGGFWGIPVGRYTTYRLTLYMKFADADQASTQRQNDAYIQIRRWTCYIS